MYGAGAIKSLHDDCADEIMGDHDSTELIKVTAIKTYGVTDMLIETKRSDEEWPRHYGEFGPPGYQHHRVFKLALYSPASGDERGDPSARLGSRLTHSLSLSLPPSLPLALSLSRCLTLTLTLR